MNFFGMLMSSGSGDGMCGFPFHDQEGVDGGHWNCEDGRAAEAYDAEVPERQARREWFEKHDMRRGYFLRSGAAGPDDLPAYSG